MAPARLTTVSIWWWALGYFAAYIPYSALTKALSSGALGQAPGPGGLEILPPTAIATVFTALVFLVTTGWWRYAGRRSIAGYQVPMPSRQTLLSGLSATGIIATTTLAYTFEGLSIVFVMLLMRGGMLLLAPVIDRVHGKHIRWFSWIALALTLGALGLVSADARATMTLACAIDIALYLACYAVRLSAMSRGGKADPATNRRYFVEEQLVTAPALVLGLAIAAAAGHDELRAGFTTFWTRTDAWAGVVIGVMSQFTGICGGMILLDPRENTFSVAVNRASSVLAGVAATGLLVVFMDAPAPGLDELAAAGLIVLAIGVLVYGPRMRPRVRA